MALFLQENISEFEIGFANFQESTAALLELSNRSAVLVESLLTADYIIEQQTKNLSEGEALDKVNDFARKAWETVKAFAKTVWAKVKEIARLVARKVKELFVRTKDLLTGNRIKVSKDLVEFYHNRYRIAERILYLSEKGFLYQSDKSIIKEYSDLIAEIRSKESANPDGEVYVSKTWFESASKETTKLSERMRDAADKQDRYLAELESKLKNDPDVQSKIQVVRVSAEALRVVAGFVNRSAAILSKNVGVDPDEVVELTGGGSTPRLPSPGGSTPRLPSPGGSTPRLPSPGGSTPRLPSPGGLPLLPS